MILHFKSISKNNYTKSTLYNESANVLRNMSINELKVGKANFSNHSKLIYGRDKFRFISKKEASHNVHILMHSGYYRAIHKNLGSITTILLNLPFRDCSCKKAKLSYSSLSTVKHKFTFKHLSDDELDKRLEGGIKYVGF